MKNGRAALRRGLAAATRAWRARRLCARPIPRQEGAAGTVSLVTTNYGNADTFAAMLADWLGFIGRRPDEVVVVDGGSGPETREVYRALFERGLIDKLFLMQPSHPENDKYRCFIQEYYSGVMASGDYLLFFKQDTIPYRRGRDGWLDEAIEMLAADPRLFAVSGSSPGPRLLGPVGDAFWCLEHTSENFALVPRRYHVEAMELCRAFWSAGWKGRNPFAHIGPVAERCLIESAWDVYCRRKAMRVLMRREDETWSMLHTNARGEELLRLRELQRDRDRVAPFLNRNGPMFNAANLGLEPGVHETGGGAG